MARMNVNLQIGSDIAGDAGLTYSNSKNVTGIFDKIFNVDNTFTQLLTIMPQGVLGTGSTVGMPLLAPEFLKICNIGDQTVDLGLLPMKMTVATDVGAAVADTIYTILRPGEFFIIPSARLFTWAATGYSPSEDKAGSKTVGEVQAFLDIGNPNDANSTDGILEFTDFQTGGDVVSHGSTIAADATTITTAAADANFIKAGDIVRHGSEDMLVTAVTAATTFTVERGYRGTSAGAISGGTTISINTQYKQGDSDTRTDELGNYQCNTFGAMGRYSAFPMGITPGSVAVRAYSEGAIQRLGLGGLSLGTNTGLSASTDYKFKIAVQGGTAGIITITTDANDLTVGSLIGLIQTELDSYYKNSAKGSSDTNLYQNKVTCRLEKGDIVFKDHSSLTTSKVVLSQASTGTELFQSSTRAGIMPLIAAIPKELASSVPNSETEQNKILFDDGYGRLTMNGKPYGTIDYETGAWSISGWYEKAHMQLSCYYNNAMSGDVRGDRDNHLFAVTTRSVNKYRRATVRVLAYDNGRDDTAARTTAGGGGASY